MCQPPEHWGTRLNGHQRIAHLNALGHTTQWASEDCSFEPCAWESLGTFEACIFAQGWGTC